MSGALVRSRVGNLSRSISHSRAGARLKGTKSIVQATIVYQLVGLFNGTPSFNGDRLYETDKRQDD